jgi:hypothetical protein
MLRCSLTLRAVILGSKPSTNSNARVRSTPAASSATQLVPTSAGRSANGALALSLEQGIRCASTDLVNSGDAVATYIKETTTSPLAAVQWMQLFSSRGVRHEAVLNAAAWKAFKAVIPQHAEQVPKSDLDVLVSSVSRAFRLTAQHQLIHDHQLLIAGVAKCVECTPAMRSRHVADVMVAMRDLGRLTLTVAESASYRSRLQSPGVVEDPLVQSSGEAHSDDGLHEQGGGVQLLDELADVLEGQIVLIAKTFTAEELVECISTLSVIGVCRSESVRALGTAAQELHMTLPQVTELLTCTSRLHSRVVDTLDYHDDADGTLRGICLPLFMAIAKRLEGVNAVTLGKQHPLLVVELRKLCERNADVNEVVPSLWEKIRGIRVSQTQVRRASNAHKGVQTISGALGTTEPKRVPRKDRLKEGLSDHSHRERYIPAHFRGWKGAKPQRRHLLVPKVASRQRFGSRRIREGFIKHIQSKFQKSNY